MEKAMARHNSRLALIFLLAVLALLPVAAPLDAPFLWDDHEILFANRAARSLGNIPHFFPPGGWNKLHLDTPSPYRPLRETVFALALAAFGRRPAAFRALNAALHALNCLLVFALCAKTLRSRRAGFWAAAVFAAMPVHVEAVAWVKNLGELASLACGLGALLVFFRGGRGGALWTACLAVAALLFKESALFVPFAMALAAWLFHEGIQRKALLRRAAPSLAAIVPYLALQIAVMAQRAAAEGTAGGLGLGARAAYVCETVAEYFRLMFLPFPLCPWYVFPPPERAGAASLAAVAFCVGLVCVIAVSWKRRPLLAWWLLWIGLSLAPAANLLVNAGRPIADQRAYAPSVGAAALLGWAVAEAVRERRRAGLALGFALVLCLAVLTAWHSTTWASGYTLWRATVKHAPARAEARENLARTYWRELGSEIQAEQEYRWAVRLWPERAKARADLAAFLLAQGRLGEAGKELGRLSAAEPGNARAAFLLGQLHEKRGEPRKAIAAQTRAVALRPDYADAYYNRGTLLEAMGLEEEAERDYRRALGIDPDYAPAASNLGYLRLRRGEANEAIGFFRQALAARPGLPQALAGLGQALRRAGRPAEALAPLERAMALRPDWTELREELDAAHREADEQP